MKVFISWSGELSHRIAIELFEWLPMVLQSVRPYMSSESIDKGTRWATSISDELEGTSVGIVVLTKENREAPWINFEAGALAKVVGDAKLAPIIFGLKPSEVGTPLSQFQVTQFEKVDVLRLLKSINASAGDEALPESRVDRMHDALWAQLHEKVDPILKGYVEPKPHEPAVKENEASVSKALEEILTLSRQQAHFVMNPERILTSDIIRQIVEASSSSRFDEKAVYRLSEHIKRVQHHCIMIEQSRFHDNHTNSDGERKAMRARLKEIQIILHRIQEIVSGHEGSSYSSISAFNETIGRPRGKIETVVVEYPSKEE